MSNKTRPSMDSSMRELEEEEVLQEQVDLFKFLMEQIASLVKSTLEFVNKEQQLIIHKPIPGIQCNRFQLVIAYFRIQAGEIGENTPPHELAINPSEILTEIKRICAIEDNKIQEDPHVAKVLKRVHEITE